MGSYAIIAAKLIMMSKLAAKEKSHPHIEERSSDSEDDILHVYDINISKIAKING